MTTTAGRGRHERRVAGNTTRDAALTAVSRLRANHCYIRESNADLQRDPRAGQGGDRRDHVARGARLLGDARPPLFLDVREPDEWQEGHLPGALHVPRGNLESRIEALVPDKARELVVYCAGGTRSAFAAKTLARARLQNVSSMAGGFTDWKRNGYEFETPAVLSRRQRARYARHLLIPEVGEKASRSCSTRASC